MSIQNSFSYLNVFQQILPKNNSSTTHLLFRFHLELLGDLKVIGSETSELYYIKVAEIKIPGEFVTETFQVSVIESKQKMLGRLLLLG